MDAEDLIAAIFPDQIACAENLVGAREIPDHPLVRQTIADCLDEAMDVAGLERLLARASKPARSAIVARDLTEPSPLALEVLSARPYAYLDDAPLEERRTQAVMGAALAGARGGRRARPARSRRRSRGCATKPGPSRPMPTNCTTRWSGSAFSTAERGASAAAAGPGGSTSWRATSARRDCLADGASCGSRPSGCRCSGRCGPTHGSTRRSPRRPAYAERDWSRDEALVEILRGRLEGLGPVTRGGARRAARARRRATSPRPSPRSKPKASRCAAASRPAPTTRNGASAGCSRASTATRSTGCAPRSSRSRRATSCAFCSTGSASRPMTRMEGPDALEAVIGQLEGFRGAGRRLGDRDPAGAARRLRAGLARRSVPRRPRRLGAAAAAHARPDAGERGAVAGARRRRSRCCARRHAPLWAALSPTADAAQPSPRRAAVADCIREHGASFFDELVEGAGSAAAAGRGGAGRAGGAGPRQLRQLRRVARAAGAGRASGRGARRRRRSLSAWRMPAAGRLARRGPARPAPGRGASSIIARALLRRYGVVFWRLLEREARLAAAVARSVARLSPARSARRDPRRPLCRRVLPASNSRCPTRSACCARSGASRLRTTWCRLSGADPLNLVGILTPGAKLAGADRQPHPLPRRVAMWRSIRAARCSFSKPWTPPANGRRARLYCAAPRPPL